MIPFIGRHQELEGLKTLLDKKNASLVIIKGRRRIGKSRLAQEFGKHFSQAYFFSGLPPAKGVGARTQKDEFARQMREFGIPGLGGDDWGDLLSDLARYCQKGKILVVLDEISWMGMKDPSFLGKLKTVWDLHFKKNPHLIIILSGSQSTWIENNIINSSGFVGRISYQLKLEELALDECAKFWGTKGRLLASYDKLKLLSVTGGVPRYLEEIQTNLSAEENIRRLCFRPEGLLFREFDQIFSDLFSRRSQTYKIIVRRLSQGPSTTEDVCKILGRNKKGRSKGGDISQHLEDLCQTGFVTRDFTWDIKEARFSKLSRYRLSDNYVRFYLKCIEPNRNRIESGLPIGLPPSWPGIMGLQFENLVLGKKNRLRLFEKLGISPDEILLANPYFQTQAGKRRGCQIDLMIQTKFNTLYLCEIKFGKNEITKEIVDEVGKKIDRLSIPRGFSLRPVLVHVNGVSDQVVEKEFFSHIINFGDFLKPDGIF